MTGVRTHPAPGALAERAFRAADHDFNSLFGRPGLMLERPPRRGVAIVVGQTTEFPDEVLDAILAWRLGQYPLTGFYDPTVVDRRGMVQEPRDDVHESDVHGLAIDADGRLCTYLTLKQPDMSETDRSLAYTETARPPFPCEETHGRAWQRTLHNTEGIELGNCWELARFVKDQRRPDDPTCARAALEVGLVAARLARIPGSRGACSSSPATSTRRSR